MHCHYRKKTAVKISGSVQERFSLSLLQNKDTCDNFDCYKYTLVGKGAEGTLRDHVSLYRKARLARSEPFLAHLCLGSDRESVVP